MAVPVVNGPIVMASHDELPVDCEKCGKRRFGVLVRIAPGSPDAQIASLVCEHCKSIFKIEFGLIRGKRTEPVNDMWKEPDYG